MSANLSLKQISAFARGTGRQLRHPPYEFYLDRIEYGLTVHETPGSTDRCAPEFEIEARMALVDRHIVIGSDVSRDACLFEAAVAHHKRHAETTKRAFNGFVKTVPARLQDALAAAASGRSARTGEVNRDVHTAFKDLLMNLDRIRQQAQSEVDSPSEVERLLHPVCRA